MWPALPHLGCYDVDVTGGVALIYMEAVTFFSAE